MPSVAVNGSESRKPGEEDIVKHGLVRARLPQPGGYPFFGSVRSRLPLPIARAKVGPLAAGQPVHAVWAEQAGVVLREPVPRRGPLYV